MKPWVRECLKRLEPLFPPERIRRSQERWRRLWLGEPPRDRLPFVYAPLSLEYYAAGFTSEERLRAHLDEFVARGMAQDDFIPAFFPGCRQATLPNLFGAPEIVKDGDYTCARLLSTYEDIERLPPPRLQAGSVAQEWLEMERYVLEETEGRLPVHPADMQGPADVAGQLFGYDKLFIAAYESPKHFHCLMTAAADAFLLFWRAQRELAGNLFVPTHLFGWDWVPPEAGASLSADSLAMISPAFYDDFYRPHLERLSRELGGLAVHACGNFSAIVPRLCHTAGVKAINAGQMAIRELIAAGADRRVLLIAGAGVEEAPAILRHANEEGWRIDLTVSGHWPVGERGVKPAAAWTQADLDLMRRREEALLAAAHDVACP